MGHDEALLSQCTRHQRGRHVTQDRVGSSKEPFRRQHEYEVLVRPNVEAGSLEERAISAVLFDPPELLTDRHAPLIALDQPFFVRTAEGLEFPFFPALFNRLLFENGVDVVFNLLFVLSPLYVLVFVAVGRGRRVRWTGRLVLVHAIVSVIVLGGSFFGVDNPLHFTAPIVDQRERVASLEAAGEEVAYLFPPRRHHYRETSPRESVEAPSRKHWLGTDKEGRDLFTRMLYGTRISLTIGVVAVGIYVAIGVVLGALAGYLGGWVDIVISRLVEIMICIPGFFLILTLVALVPERSIFDVMIIIGITSWTGVARLVRAEFLQQKGLDYVQAARVLGIPRWRIIFAHTLPNCMGPVLVSATFGIASAILVESTLAFLGLGDLSVPSWGEALNTGRVEQKLWLILAPGFAIFFVVSVFNLVGEGLRDALDPKLRA